MTSIPIKIMKLLFLIILFLITNANLYSDDIVNDTIKLENYQIIKVFAPTSNNIIEKICIKKINIVPNKLRFIIYDTNNVVIRNLSFHNIKHYHYKFKEKIIRIQLYYKDNDIVWDSLWITVSDDFKLHYKQKLEMCKN